MKLNSSNRDQRPGDSPKAIRAQIWMDTAVVVANGLFACYDIATDGYISGAISIFVMALYVSELFDLWSLPCNSSR